MAIGGTLHIVSGGYHVEPVDVRGNPLATASAYHVLPIVVPVPPLPTRTPLVDINSPVATRATELDYTRPFHTPDTA